MKKGTLNIGTWPTPEKPVYEKILEVLELLETVVQPVETVKEISPIIIDFRKKICKILEASIRSDIGCLCKYNRPEVDLCTHPKIKECLSRLIKTGQFYQKFCCSP